MTKREISKYNSFAQIASALEVHAPVYSEHVQLVKGADDFAGFLERLDALSTRQSAQTGGIAKDKARALELLGNQAFKVAAGLAACAHDNENGDLAGRVAYSRTHITRGPEAAIISRCRGLQADATEFAAQIIAYGVSNVDITMLKKKIDAFQALQPKPRRAKAGKSSVTKELKKVVRETGALLKNKLDKLVVQFKESDPDFYNEYNSARKLVDAPSSSSSKKPNVVPVPNPAVTSKAA